MSLVVLAHASMADHNDISPELALVDPALGAGARSRLVAPPDTLGRIDALVRASRMATLTEHAIEAPGHDGPRIRERLATILGRRTSAVLAGGVVAVLLAVALLMGVRVDLNGDPAGADTSISEENAFQAPPPSTGEGSEASGPAPQRFAWAPTPGATAYHLELFLGPTKIFEADAKRPVITVPARWTYVGRRHSLDPGSYRWYVWPVVSGTRAASAVVQAKLVVERH